MGKIKADILLEESFEQYSKAIEKFCYVRLGEASDYASDCLQETYCLFYRKLLDGTEFENPRAFLYKTANNMVLKAKENYYKNAKRTKSLDEAENIPTYIEESIEDKIENNDVDIDFAKSLLLSSLDDDELILYQMKYVERLSLKEISDKIHISPSAVAMRTSRLRSKVKALVIPTLTEIRKGGS